MKIQMSCPLDYLYKSIKITEFIEKIFPNDK